MKFDRLALRLGVSTALLFALPSFAIAAYLTRGDRTSSVTGLLVLIALAGFVIGAGVAGVAQRLRLPISHGFATAVIAYLIPQVVFTAIAVARGEEVRVLNLLFLLSTVSVAGVIGGAVGGMMRSRGIMLPSLRALDTDVDDVADLANNGDGIDR